jgi:uncharacterized protein YdhG (YjbR/CyaY superfamily)
VSRTAEGVAAVEAHLAGLPEPQQSTLRAVRASLRAILPEAEECLKYRMPAFVVDGKTVAGYDGFKNHCSYFPHSGGVVPRAGAILDGYDADRGTLRFAIDRPLPRTVLRRLVKIRLEEIAEQEAARASKRKRP